MIGVKSPSKVVRLKQLAATLTSTSSPALNGEYFYIRNAQGDIIGLFDKDMNQVVSYIYDSWGKLISINGTLKDSIGVKNPYRYRGYWYDSETGLYYLNSRYYNPEWGRYLNADGLIGKTGELLAHNMFTYCGNNPINMKYPNGTSWFSVLSDVGSKFVTGLLVVLIALTVLTMPQPLRQITFTSNKERSKETTKTKTIPNTKKQKNKEAYVAKRDFKQGGIGVDYTKPLPELLAIERVQSGKDIYVPDANYARKIALVSGDGVSPGNPERDYEKWDYVFHYHPKGEHPGPHVFTGSFGDIHPMIIND